MKSGVVNIHAIIQLMIGKICVIKWLLMPGKSWDKAYLNQFFMDGLDYIASICSLISEEKHKEPGYRKWHPMDQYCSLQK